MDTIAMEKLVSTIVMETIKSILPTILSSIERRPESVMEGQGKAENRKASTIAKKAGKLVKSASNDVDAFNVVKKYVLARKAGTIEKGPFLTCYRHITENSTLDDVIKSSETAKRTLYKEAQKVLNYKG